MKRRFWSIVVAGVVLLVAAALLSAARGGGKLATGLLLAGGIAWTAAVVLSWRDLTHYLTRRSARYGMNAFVLSFLVLVILFLVGFVAGRHSWRSDFTAAREFSLSDKTLNVLQGIQKRVDIHVFYERAARDVARDLLREYTERNPLVRFQMEDLNKDPERAERYGVTSLGTMVFDTGDKIERIATFGEEDVTNALIKVSRPGKKKVYFLTEHGEKDVAGKGMFGYFGVAEALRRENYDVAPLSLAHATSVPADCDILVIAGARSGLLDHEVAQVQKYLEAGGRLFCLFDPRFNCGLEGYVSVWGVLLRDDRVVDPSPTGQLLDRGPSVPLVSHYGVHPITRQFKQPTYFPMVRSVSPHKYYSGKAEGAVLAFTSDQSWADSDPFSEHVAYGDPNDVAGPVPIAMAVRLDLTEAVPQLESAVSTPRPGDASVESGALKAAGAAASKEARLVVFGDSDFAANQSFADMGNGNLFLNCVAWLAQDEQLIAVRAKDPDLQHISLTKAELGVLSIVSLAVVPGFVALLGLVVAVRRRSKG